MTARVTTLKGPGAGAYYVEALPSYYLDNDEPRGRWHGHGAAQLGLTGDVDDDVFLRVMAGHSPTGTAVHLGRPYGDDSVRGFDVTASAPKSVSTLFALGDAATRAEVLAAHDTAVAAMVSWIETHAHTRYRINGDVAVVDAEGIVAAEFRQHTSRALDPQLHTHVVIANRVRSPDGRWLALDARSLKMDQRTVSAIYHAALRSEMTRRLGVAWQDVTNGTAELDLVPTAVLEEFSQRTSDVNRRIDVKIDRFTDTFDRHPTPRERWRLEREAVVDSRPAKPHPADPDLMHTHWTQRVDALGLDPARVVDDATGWLAAHDLDVVRSNDTVAAAMAALAEKQSSWRPAEITREIAAALPTDTGIDPAHIAEMLDRLTDQAIRQYCVDISRPIPDDALLRGDGRPITESIADRALTTPDILAQEARLLEWAQRRTANTDHVAAVDHSRVALTGPQAETAAAVAGHGDLVLVVGPAGTGKTTALTPAVARLRADGRPVFGVAPSATAADVLAAETGVEADTVDKLLTEHNRRRPPDRRYDLPVGATVIVDEAAMVPTDRLDQLAALADTRGWRIALVGDPMQFSAVGRGGMFGLLVDTCGAIELDRVHRFIQPWERDASLRLRSGDATVADLYQRHGRLHGGTDTHIERDALDAWHTARQHGETVVLAAPTNDTVARLNHAAQQRRIDTGELTTRGRTVDAGGYRLHVGDEIVTRRNDRTLTTDRQLPVHNRDQWVIATVHRNGDLTATGASGRVRLPAVYVSEHVELGYAQTSHATQGRTVDRSILVLHGPTDIRGLYVPMTRGRHHNDAYIALTGETTALDVFVESINRSWIDQPAHTRQADLAELRSHRPGTLLAADLRRLFDQRAELVDHLDRLRTAIAELPLEAQWAREDHRREAAALDTLRNDLQRANVTLAEHDRPFRRRGHETDIAAAKRTVAHLPPRIDAQTATVERLAGHAATTERQLTEARHVAVQRPGWEHQVAAIDDQLEPDRQLRARQIRRDPHRHILDSIGARPTGGEPARTWDHAAGHLDQHHTAHSHTGLRPQRLGDDPGRQHSHDLTQNAINNLARATAPARHPGIERDSPHLGIER